MAVRIAISALLLFFFSQNAFPFVPESSFIFNDLAKNNRKVQTYKIKQTRTLFGSQYENGSLEVREEIFLKVPWQYARISFYKEKSQMTVYNGSRFIKITDGKWVEPREKPPILFICGFYLGASGSDISAYLVSRGINPEEGSYSRINDLISLAFTGRNQPFTKIYLARETYWPIAYSTRASEGSRLKVSNIELLFSNYQRVSNMIYFPMKTDKIVDGTTTEQVRVSDVAVNIRLSPSLFDFSFLKKKYPQNREKAPQVFFEWEKGIE